MHTLIMVYGKFTANKGNNIMFGTLGLFTVPNYNYWLC